jgi:hypothetical protein
LDVYNKNENEYIRSTMEEMNHTSKGSSTNKLYSNSNKNSEFLEIEPAG